MRIEYGKQATETPSVRQSRRSPSLSLCNARRGIRADKEDLFLAVLVTVHLSTLFIYLLPIPGGIDFRSCRPSRTFSFLFLSLSLSVFFFFFYSGFWMMRILAYDNFSFSLPFEIYLIYLHLLHHHPPLFFFILTLLRRFTGNNRPSLMPVVCPPRDAATRRAMGHYPLSLSHSHLLP